MSAQNKYAIITGASSGIGAEFARQLAKKGYRLIITARREERLVQLKERIGTECEIITADLSKEEEVYRFYRKIADRPVAVFINNAGFGNWGTFAESDLKKELNMIDLNVRAVHILTKLIVRKMSKQNYGYLLNVASSAGLMPAGPYMAAYYATKAYVASLTRAVAEELREKKSGVFIGCLCPGPVDTEFNSAADVEFSLKGISASECVRFALAGMKKRKVVIVPTVIMRTALLMERFCPQEFVIYLTRFQQKKKGEIKNGKNKIRGYKRGK